MIPRDYYGTEFPQLHNRDGGAAYMEPDYLANCTDGQLPLLSTIGRGPQGEGLYVGNVVTTDDTVSFGLYSTLTGELVWQSPNLAPAEISFDVTDFRDVVPGVAAPLDIIVNRGGVTKTTTAYLPAGTTGSLVYLLDTTLARTKDDTYETTIEQLSIYGRLEYENKPIPRPNDIVFFSFTDSKGYGIAFGTIEDVGGTTRYNDETPASNKVVFTARTFIHIPPVSIGKNGNWYVAGEDTGVQAKGEKGDKGDKGDKGAKGPKGEKGATGAKGEAGKAAVVKVGDTIQLDPSASAYVKDLDSSESNALLEFGIPQGRPAKITDIVYSSVDPVGPGSATIEQISSNENTYKLGLNIPRGEDGRNLDVQHGIWTINDLPDFDTTEINTAFVVVISEDRKDLYIRGRIAHDAELGGPWTIVEDIFPGPRNYDELLNKPLVLSDDGKRWISQRDAKLPVEWGAGELATIQGKNTVASGASAHAEGIGTKASSEAQHVQGKYNVEDKAGEYACIVGGGTSKTRQNIHTLDWSGNADYAGNVVAHDTTRSHELVLKADKTYVDDQDTKVKEEAEADATKKSDAALKAAKEYTDSEINELATVAKTGRYDDLKAKPDLAKVATSGSYNDLTDTPNIFAIVDGQVCVVYDDGKD